MLIFAEQKSMSLYLATKGSAWASEVRWKIIIPFFTNSIWSMMSLSSGWINSALSLSMSCWPVSSDLTLVAKIIFLNVSLDRGGEGTVFCLTFTPFGAGRGSLMEGIQKSNSSQPNLVEPSSFFFCFMTSL